jgi:membrane associated rhomboid family serine protease
MAGCKETLTPTGTGLIPNERSGAGACLRATGRRGGKTRVVWGAGAGARTIGASMAVEEQGARAAPGAPRGRWMAASVTVGIVVLCVGAFVATLASCAFRAYSAPAVFAGSWIQLEGCGEALGAMGALRLADVWLDGAWWRVVTAGFLHGSWLHLGLNAWSLWVVGEWVEGTWGHLRTAVLFLGSSVAGCVASAAWVEAPVVVGASAGIMGMAGALLVARLLGRGALVERLRPVSPGVLGGYLLVLVAVGFFVDVIAQAGHLGGLAAGALLGLGWCGRGPRWTVASGVGLLALLGTLAFGAAHPEGRPRYDELLGFGQLERQLPDEAAASLDRALARRPDDAGLANAVAYALANAGTELQRAEALVRQALVEEPENADYLDTLGWVLCRRGAPEAGLAELRQALERSTGQEQQAEIERHLVECEAAAVE